MSRFTTYAIREISSSFLLLIILLSSILWLGQGLRHIELLTTDNVSFISYLSYILLLLPKILLLTIKKHSSVFPELEKVKGVYSLSSEF